VAFTVCNVFGVIFGTRLLKLAIELISPREMPQVAQCHYAGRALDVGGAAGQELDGAAEKPPDGARAAQRQPAKYKNRRKFLNHNHSTSISGNRQTSLQVWQYNLPPLHISHPSVGTPAVPCD